MTQTCALLKSTVTAKYRCLYCCPIDRLKHAHVIAVGAFIRKSDRRKIRRYKCLDCKKSFSDATVTLEYRQRKRHINLPLFKLLASATTLRRSAILMGIHRATVDRRLVYFAKVADREHEKFLRTRNPSTHVQFDDMESSEHTKMKPLSIPLIVDQVNYKILAYDVVSMPAKGLLAAASRKKYGLRPDHRPKGWREVLTKLQTTAIEGVTITSDKHKMYPIMIQRHIPHAVHIQVKSRRACVVGQGELKRGGFDRLFALNHAAAILRADVSRLARRTWNTTKRPDRLKAHIALYVLWRNETITAREERRRRRYPYFEN